MSVLVRSPSRRHRTAKSSGRAAAQFSRRPACRGHTASSSRRHAWERYGPLDAGYRGDPDWGWDASSSEGEATPAEAGEELASLLIRLRLQGTLSAKQACVLAHWATAAGALGSCALFAVGPNAPSGHYQRRLDSYLGVAEDDASFYHVDVPGHDKAQASRMVHRVEVVPPHEALAAEYAGSPSVMERLHQSIAANEWAASYNSHPVVLASPPGTVLPLALYIDGVPYSRHDGFLGFWV